MFGWWNSTVHGVGTFNVILFQPLFHFFQTIDSIQHIQSFNCTTNYYSNSHCKRFAQTYESIAAHLHSTTSIKVAKIDGSKERALSSRFSIKGYPSFYLISGWDIYEYKKTRSKENMVQFAMQKEEGMGPMSMVNSPFGPFGMTRGFVMNTGTRILDLFEYLVERGLGKTAAAVIMAGVGVFVGTIFVILVGLALLPKPKVD
jgi:hypothetical protein